MKLTRIKNDNLKEEFKDKIINILERNNLKFNGLIEVLFYEEKHENCPLGFDLELKDNSLILDVLFHF